MSKGQKIDSRAAGASRGPSARAVFEGIARRIEAGETVSPIARRYAEEFLGRRILRGGKHAVRPDHMDRAAGDIPEADEGMVAL